MYVCTYKCLYYNNKSTIGHNKISKIVYCAYSTLKM